jgi:hypothetical protein
MAQRAIAKREGCFALRAIEHVTLVRKFYAPIHLVVEPVPVEIFNSNFLSASMCKTYAAMEMASQLHLHESARVDAG